MITPWWTHHCAGNLEPENDPYSDKFENPFYGSDVKTWRLILAIFTPFIHGVWYAFGFYKLVKYCFILGTFGYILVVVGIIVLVLIYCFVVAKTIRLILK